MRIYYILYFIVRRWGPQQPRARQASVRSSGRPPLYVRMVAYKRHLVNTAASAALRASTRYRVCRIFKWPNGRGGGRGMRAHTCVPTNGASTSTSPYIGARRVGRSSLSPLGLIEIYEIVLAPAGQSRATAIRRRLHGIHACAVLLVHACTRASADAPHMSHSVYMFIARVGSFLM